MYQMFRSIDAQNLTDNFMVKQAEPKEAAVTIKVQFSLEV